MSPRQFPQKLSLSSTGKRTRSECHEENRQQQDNSSLETTETNAFNLETARSKLNEENANDQAGSEHRQESDGNSSKALPNANKNLAEEQNKTDTKQEVLSTRDDIQLAATRQEKSICNIEPQKHRQVNNGHDDADNVRNLHNEFRGLKEEVRILVDTVLNEQNKQRDNCCSFLLPNKLDEMEKSFVLNFRSVMTEAIESIIVPEIQSFLGKDSANCTKKLPENLETKPTSSTGQNPMLPGSKSADDEVQPTLPLSVSDTSHQIGDETLAKLMDCFNAKFQQLSNTVNAVREQQITLLELLNSKRSWVQSQGLSALRNNPGTPTHDRFGLSRVGRRTSDRMSVRGASGTRWVSETPCSWALSESLALSDSQMTLTLNNSRWAGSAAAYSEAPEYKNHQHATNQTDNVVKTKNMGNSRVHDRASNQDASILQDSVFDTQFHFMDSQEDLKLSKTSMFNEHQFRSLLSYGDEVANSVVVVPKYIGIDDESDKSQIWTPERVLSVRPQSAPTARRPYDDSGEVSFDLSGSEYNNNCILLEPTAQPDATKFGSKQSEKFLHSNLLVDPNSCSQLDCSSKLKTITEVDSTSQSSARSSVAPPSSMQKDSSNCRASMEENCATSGFNDSSQTGRNLKVVFHEVFCGDASLMLSTASSIVPLPFDRAC